MTPAQKEAFDLGVKDGKRAYSVSNPYTYSVLMTYYCRGFEIGSQSR